MQLNDLSFAGFVGKDASEFQTKNGKRIVSFNLCHTQKGRDGHADISTWVRVKVFGNWCDTAIQIKKGDNVFVKGQMQISEYTKDDVKRMMLEVLANSIAIIKKVDKIAEEAPVVNYDDIPF